MSKDLRIIFLGMETPFSATVLDRLLRAPHEITAILLPGSNANRPESQNEIPLIAAGQPPSVEALARSHSIQMITVESLQRVRIAPLLDELEAQIGVVACFDRILPSWFMQALPHGLLNVHPSLLPRYRGPDPLFWQLRAGEESIGVTIHWIDEGLDTGPIAAETSLTLADGLTGAEIDHRAAAVSADLLLTVLDALSNGKVEATPQTGEPSYQGLPKPADFSLDLSWTARRAFNFMRAAAHWNQPFLLKVENGKTLRLHQAVSWDSDLDRKGYRDGVVSRGETIEIRFDDGLLVATVF